MNALRAKRCGPFIGDEVRIGGSCDPVVGGNDKAVGRVHHLGQFIKWNETCAPQQGIPAFAGQHALPVALVCTDRDTASGNETNVSASIGDHHVLLGTMKVPHHLDEIDNGLRGCGVQSCPDRELIIVQDVPAERDTLVFGQETIALIAAPSASNRIGPCRVLRTVISR